MLQEVNKKVKIKEHERKYVVKSENPYRLWLLDNQKVEEVLCMLHQAIIFSVEIFESKQGKQVR